jgi:Tol biopolymer transport system component
VGAVGKDAPGVTGRSESSPANGRLDSWKEIGAYLKRDVTTVRRWEKREGLPVHRHLHDRRDTVYAFRIEIDTWWQGRRNHLTEPAAEDGVPQRGEGGKPRALRLASIAAALLAISTLSLAVVHFREAAGQPTERRAVRFSVSAASPSGDFAFSPDGRLLAYVGGSEDDTRLWIQALDSLTPRSLAGTEGAESPFWSPDSRFIAFGAKGKLRKVAVSGGPVHTLCDARVVLGGTWNRDDVIVFTPDNRTPLFRVPAAGGEPTPVTTLDRSQGQNTHRWPHFLPDGGRFLYLARSPRPDQSGIYVGSLDSPAVTRVLSAESKVAYAQPGYLLFVRDKALLAQPFDATALRIEGDPVQVLEDVRYSRSDSYASVSISEHGELAYQTTAAVPRSNLAWFNRTGQPLESVSTLHDADDPSISPDGKRVAVTRSTGSLKDIWIVDLARGNSRVTADPSVEFTPIWSPDGHSIVFASNRDGPSDLYRTAASGAGRAEPLLNSSAVKHPTDWSLDGRTIVYDVDDPKTSWDLWTLPVGGGAATPFLQTEFAEGFGRLSPDSRWMAYVSDESGTNEVYIRPFPPSTGKWKISTAGGTVPRWRRDGKELFYIAPDGTLMSVSVQAASMFLASLPKVLFKTRMSQNGEWGYDISPDGHRFAISMAVGDSTPAPITIILNWTSGLRPATAAGGLR